MKKILIGLFILFVVIIIAGTSLVSATGIVEIPVFSDIFYREKISDLGIETVPEAAKNLEQKLGILGKGLLYIAPEQIPLPKTVPGDIITEIEITDVGLSSWINITCLDLAFLAPCPFENFQIKFTETGFASSVRILNPFEVNITVFGSIFRKDETTIDLKIKSVYIGNVWMPLISSELEKRAEEIINKNLIRMESLRIDRLETLKGKIAFEGILKPSELSNLLAEGLYYKPMVEDIIHIY